MNSYGCFDCNICLASLGKIQDPVLTHCAHLYCWPCIYEWLNFQSDSNSPSQCPVCKAGISESTLVPIYGQGTSSPPTEEHENTKGGRYKPGRLRASSSRRVHDHALTCPSPSTMHMFGLLGRLRTPMTPYKEMVYARVFGNSSEASLYSYQNSYYCLEFSSPRTGRRVRRQEMKAEKSLSIISSFLLCFSNFCLVVF
ncbi:hypothetical protein GIB67_037967 [Kingdonia uniflora]|uniref:E3 ubiquitin-protein ligase RMA n=1 Tax=Kingdonia uniflora TaxID=39325 RepID=A0A7J7LHI0_9MAGN|nr:hypothetical protein GIB67_037967 [Kingdonia uniflora]